ncbi:hypothetical protein NOK12_16320 [Nocardioides sp. OK12]|nr:hypothetical protein NOK12_16320 [Nocardioides sp. OK12]
MNNSAQSAAKSAAASATTAAASAEYAVEVLEDTRAARDEATAIVIADADTAMTTAINTPGSQVGTALSASYGGQGFDVIEDFSAYPDGPLAGAATTSTPGGAALTWYSESTGGAVVPIIEDGALTIPEGVDGTIRAVLDLPADAGDIIGIGMEVSYLGAWSDGSALACMTIMDGPFSESLPKMPVHLVASAEAWSLDVNNTIGTGVEASGLGGLNDGGNLLTNGTRYRWEVALDKTSERAYVTDQRGNVLTEFNTAFLTPGRRAYFQVLRPNHAANTRPRIHKAWITTRRIDRIVSARAVARTNPRPQVVTVEGGTHNIGGSVISVTETAVTLPIPSSRAVRITGTAVVNVTTAGDFYLGVATAGAPTALMSGSESAKIVRAGQGTGTFSVAFDILLPPDALNASVGRIGDLVTIQLATISAGGAGSFVVGGGDRIRAAYQPLPFLG